MIHIGGVKKMKPKIFNFSLILITAILFVPFIFAVLLSMRDLYAGVPFSAANFIGLDNYADLLSKYMPDAFFSSFIISLCCGIAGGILVFALTAALNNMPRKISILISAVLSLFPAVSILFPFTAILGIIFPFTDILGIASGYPADISIIAIYCAYEAVTLAPIMIIPLILSNSCKTPRGALKAALIFFAARILFSFVFNGSDLYIMVNGFTGTITHTVSEYIYNMTRIDGNFSSGAGLCVLNFIFSIPPLALFVFIAHYASEKKLCISSSALIDISLLLSAQDAVLFLALYYFHAAEFVGSILINVYFLIKLFIFSILIWRIIPQKANKILMMIPFIIMILIRYAVSFRFYFLSAYPYHFIGRVSAVSYGQAVNNVPINYTPFIILGIISAVSVIVCGAIADRSK